MIKVNLHQRKAAVGVTVGSATGGSAGLQGLIAKLRGGSAGADGLNMDMLGNQKAGIILAAVYAVILAGGWWFLDDQKIAMIAEVDAEISALEDRTNRLNSDLGKTSGYEQVKKDLEANEKAIKTKISTIEELIRDRGAAPKILMTLSEAIPKEVWLNEFALQNRKFRITGRSNGMDLVSDFMRSLEETIYFKGVVLRSSREEETLGRSSASFEIEAERR